MSLTRGKREIIRIGKLLPGQQTDCKSVVVRLSGSTPHRSTTLVGTLPSKAIDSVRRCIVGNRDTGHPGIGDSRERPAAAIAQLAEPWVAGSNPARGSRELTLPVSNAALTALRNRTLVVLREARQPPVRLHQTGGTSLIRKAAQAQPTERLLEMGLPVSPPLRCGVGTGSSRSNHRHNSLCQADTLCSRPLVADRREASCARKWFAVPRIPGQAGCEVSSTRSHMPDKPSVMSVHDSAGVDLAGKSAGALNGFIRRTKLGSIPRPASRPVGQYRSQPNIPRWPLFFCLGLFCLLSLAGMVWLIIDGPIVTQVMTSLALVALLVVIFAMGKLDV